MAVRAGVNGKLDAKVARCQVGRVLRQFDSKRIVIYANVTQPSIAPKKKTQQKGEFTY